MNNILYNIYPLLIEVYLVFSANMLLIYGVLFSSSWKQGYPLLNQNLSWLVFQIISLSILLLISQEPFNLLIWNNFLVSDNFSYGVKFIILLSFLSWINLTFSYTLQEKINSFEYWVLILLAIVALMLIVQTYDLLAIYLTIELQSLIFYVLATFKRTSEFSTEAGLKYFILGAFSSALLLFGSSLLYSLTGLSNLGDFSKLFTGILVNNTLVSIGVATGLIFIIVSFLFKLSSAPFHMWSPDVYEGSPTSITAFFSILPKIAIISLLIRVLIFSFQDLFFIWKDIILICALLSIFIGTMGAFSQKKWKRFLAYSSINHIGFFLLAFVTSNIEGITSLIFYIITYIIMMLGIFSFIMNFRIYVYPNVYQTRYLKELVSIGKSNPTLSITLALCLFSMAGIPPLLGFFSKLFIILCILQKSMFGSAIFAIIMSCIACFYYIRLIKIMYFDINNIWIVTFPPNKLSTFLASLLIIFILFLFLDIELISLFTSWVSLTCLS